MGAYRRVVNVGPYRLTEAELQMLGEPLTYDDAENGYEPSMFDRGRTLDRVTKARIAENVDKILAAIGPDNLDPQGTERTPQRVAEMFDELLSGYSIDPEQPFERGAVRRRVRPDGRREIDRILQPLRAPPATVLRVRARRILARQEGDRAVQDSPHSRHVRPPTASSRANDAGDCDLPRLVDRA